MIINSFKTVSITVFSCFCLLVMGSLTGCRTNQEKIQDASRKLRETALNTEIKMKGRRWAVKSLDRLPPKYSYPTFMKLAKDGHTPAPLRRRAVWALGRTSMSEAIPPVTEALREAQEEKTAYFACTALAKLSPDFPDLSPGERRKIFIAVNAAEGRFADSKRVRGITALLLTQASAADIFQILKKACAEKPENWQKRAFAALCRLGSRIVKNPEVVNDDIERQTVDHLCKLAESDSTMLRYKSLWYLGRIAPEEEEAKNTLAARMLHADDAKTRLLASWALWRTDPQRFKKTVPQPLDSSKIPPDPETWRDVRKEARELGEKNLQIHRLWNDLLKEEAMP